MLRRPTSPSDFRRALQRPPPPLSRSPKRALHRGAPPEPPPEAAAGPGPRPRCGRGRGVALARGTYVAQLRLRRRVLGGGRACGTHSAAGRRRGPDRMLRRARRTPEPLNRRALARGLGGPLRLALSVAARAHLGGGGHQLHRKDILRARGSPRGGRPELRSEVCAEGSRDSRALKGWPSSRTSAPGAQCAQHPRALAPDPRNTGRGHPIACGHRVGCGNLGSAAAVPSAVCRCPKLRMAETSEIFGGEAQTVCRAPLEGKPTGYDLLPRGSYGLLAQACALKSCHRHPSTTHLCAADMRAHRGHPSGRAIPATPILAEDCA